MWTTKKLVKSLKKANDNCTSYRIHKLLDVSSQTVLNWENKGTVMTDEIGLKVASLLGLDETIVLVDLQLERVKGTASEVHWRSICEKFEAAAA
jgi:hypothetical protein